MMPIQLLAVAIGIVCLILIVVVSMHGPRDAGGRLPGNGGPIVPYGDDDFAGDS